MFLFSPSPHHGSQTIQSPPKRVDELMSELADFDPSIQPSDIAEPVPSRSRFEQNLVFLLLNF
jgi:hypothetical protein